MPDNPYRSASDVLATLPGAAALTAALDEPSSIAPPGASADDAGISSEESLNDPVVSLVRRDGIALADRSRNLRRILAAIGVLATLGLGVAAYFTQHSGPFAGAAIVLALAIIAYIYYFPAPAMVMDSRGIWIVRRLRTDFCEWVALRSADVKDHDGQPQVTITLKGPEHVVHNRHTFSGRLRRPDTQRIRLGESDAGQPKAPGHRHGAFETFDKGGEAGLGMHPAFNRQKLADVLSTCIEAFGTPDDVVVPRRATEPIVIDPSEFDSPVSDRRPQSAIDNVANPASPEND